MSDPILNGPVLDAPVEEHLRSSIPPGDAERMWRSFKLRQQAAPARRASQLRKRAAWATVGTLTIAAAAAMMIALVHEPARGPLNLAGGHALPNTLGARETPNVFDLDDGSRIVLAPETDAQIVANAPDQIHATLARGSATFDVRPGGPRRWIVEAGAARVEVLGTRFTVTRRANRVEVHVDRGVVAVHFPGREVSTLRAGESVALGVPTERGVPDERGPPVEPEQPITRSPAEDDPPPLEPRGTERLWRERAARGDYTGAYRILGSRGLRASAAGANPEELLLLADIARRSAHPADAMHLYQQLMERAPADLRAPVAAFSLGRLQAAREPEAAATSFSFVRSHAAGGALIEDATGLEAEAALRAGHRAHAERVARIYLESFPNGRRAESMHQMLTR